MKPFISICIPTYNRANYLDYLLRSIFEQSAGVDLQVCVSDNSSTDGTRELLEKIAKNDSRLKFRIQEVNVGPDRNYFSAVALADGTYCWLMGSDDALAPGSLKFLADEIQQTCKKIYLAPRINCSIDMKELAQESWIVPNTTRYFNFLIENQRDLYFERSKNLGALFSYLSSIVVRRESWNQWLPPEKYYRTAYSHSYTLLKVADSSGIQYLERPIVLNRTGNDHFAQDGHAKRIMLDMRGYLMLAQDLYDQNLHRFEKALAVLRRSHPAMQVIPALRARMSKEEWNDARQILIACGYSRELVHACNWIRLPLRLMLKMKHVMRGRG